MTSTLPEALQWDVHGLRFAGLAWGDPTSPPVLALHGWLDNAASFLPLAGRLAEHYYVVALDLSGHGYSDWRSADATYQIYDDLPQLHGIIKQLGWSRFTLMGHSRGAIISCLFAATFPHFIDKLVLLDGAVPQPLEASGFVDQMRRFVDEKERLLARKPRVYASADEAIALRADKGLEAAAAKLIAQRNLRECEGGVCWRTDPRLRGASAVKMTRKQIEVMLSALSMPCLLMRAESGLATKHAEDFARLLQPVPALQVETSPGGHHFHMETGVDDLAARLQRFLQPEQN